MDKKETAKESDELPQWAPRVAKQHIAQLYVANAKGILDEELIDEVGIGLLARCESILTVTDASRGNVLCPKCGELAGKQKGTSEGQQRSTVLFCEPCYWRLSWKRYKRSYQGKLLIAGVMEPFIEAYVKHYSKSATYREKMILIDQLIHRFHEEEKENRAGRIGAAALIQGKLKDIVIFLDTLTYGEQSLPETRKVLNDWRKQLEANQKKKKFKK